MGYQQDVIKRRTFAIISHPDAGKTTLTEKLLLFGNIIRSAGTVKGKKSGKYATSDWMEIEKKRGISVTSSVMSFPYNKYYVNILDTPGHEDFSEDTYRTLTAVDSVVMVIDSTKGVEPQTIKLFKVCKMRGIPIFTFINKLDREGKEPLELLAEIEEVLGIDSYAMNYPVGMGKRFLGLYDRNENAFIQYKGNEQEKKIPLSEISQQKEIVDNPTFIDTVKEVELLTEAGNNYSIEAVQKGELTPVFFGSAISNFGVKTFFDTFLTMATSPKPRKSTDGYVEPQDPNFSGFVFKIQANMNPAHRDRIAFIRVCTGKFERGMTVTLDRTQKKIKLGQSQQFLASDRDTVEEAFPGDIIGIYDPNQYQIGDTIYSGNQQITYDEMPVFPPEFFQKVTTKNVMKSKQFKKGIEQLVQEGAIQLFKTYSMDEFILGAVGHLQFEVLEYRMNAEYNVAIQFESLGERIPRWLDAKKVNINDFNASSLLVKDKEGNLAVLFENDFSLRWFEKKNPDIELIDLFQVSNYKQAGQ